jgi:glycosyltransferase involved in cell wall biosynthesis
MDCSVVVPVFNEAEVLPAFYERLTRTLDALGASVEIIFVNDGSSDNTLSILRDLQRCDDRVKILSLSRNFGHQAAITAGTDHSRGQSIVILDGDLQDPPELIPELFRKWKEGFEVVYAVRARREGESAFKRITAALFYRLFRRVTDLALPLDTGDYRLVGRRALDALRGMRERHRFVRGMVSWIGFRQTGVSYVRGARPAGRTKYPLSRMIRLGLDAVTSFSFLPLKMASYLGFSAAGVSFLVIVWVLYVKAIQKGAVPGWASEMVAILFLGGVQLISLGILGEYIGRIYDEVRGRPLYIIEDFVGDGELSREPGPENNHGRLPETP